MKKRFIILVLFFLQMVTLSAQKTNMFVRQAVLNEHTVHRKAVALHQPYQEKTITAFVKFKDASVLRDNGCRLLAQWDDICIASIPLDKVNTLLASPKVLRVEAGRSCCLQNDTTAMKLHTRELWQKQIEGNQGLTGKGVVVGVMDLGFDLTHPTYLSQDGTRYRVQRLWDMIDYTEGGHAVEGIDTTYVGRQYIGEEELLAKQHSADGLDQTHGTHTSGTAVGSGREDNSHLSSLISHPYAGAAPDADVCLVANACSDNADLVPEEDRYKYTTATDMLGFKYIFDYAESVGKPCVISFSEGSHEDLYESGLYNEVLHKMLGPGRILCVAAGNEGYKQSYLHKPLGKESAGAFLSSYSNYASYVMRSGKPIRLKLTFYDAGSEEKQVWQYDAAELLSSEDSIMKDTVRFKNFVFPVQLDTYPSCYDENKYATDFVIQDSLKASFGQQKVFVSMTLLNADDDVEAFNAGGFFVANKKDPTLADAEISHNVLFPGTLDDVISVGGSAYVMKRTNYCGEPIVSNPVTGGALYPASSFGPSMKGNIKPDVLAPGQCVVSSMSSYYLENHHSDAKKSWEVRHFDYGGRTYGWNANSGTSMACPAVAGIVALWLQVCPTLTADQLRDIFAHTCFHYDNTLDYPNNMYGYGQIDALAGVEYVEKEYSGIENVKSENNGMKNNGYYTLDGLPQSDIQGKHGIFVLQGTGKKIIIK